MKARNALGWGPASSTVAPAGTIAASAAPAQITSLSTSIDAGVDALSVKISWIAPAANADDIVGYQIYIRRHGDVEFSEDTTNCLGWSDAASGSAEALAAAEIVQATSCFVPLTTLTSSNEPSFALQYNELVVARVRARNSIAWG